MWLDSVQEAILRRVADDALDLLAVLEEDQGRNALDAELPLRLRVVVDVELGDLEATRILLCDLLEHGGDHAAGAAPFGPEVDQDRLVGLDDLALEGGV